MDTPAALHQSPPLSVLAIVVYEVLKCLLLATDQDLATARGYGATLWTHDADFEG